MENTVVALAMPTTSDAMAAIVDVGVRHRLRHACRAPRVESSIECSMPSECRMLYSRMPTGKLGFRVLPAPPRIDDTILDCFRGLASPNLADAMGRFNFMDPAIQARSGLPLCGLAVTVNARPADNLMLHKALDIASPGDVVVVNTCGNTTSAIFGELMCH